MKTWNEKEDEFIKNNTQLTLAELSNKMGRSMNSVKFKKAKLGLKLKGDVERWSKKEIQFLMNNNSTLNHRIIAQKLGRTPMAVRRKIDKLGITSERVLISDENKWTEKEDVLLIKNKDKSIVELMSILPDKSRDAIYGRKHKLGAIKYKLWTAKENQTIQDNLDKSDIEIGKLINRSIYSVKTQRRKLGLLKHQPNKKWTEEDEIYLEENYDKDKKELAEHLGVSTKRVHMKLIYMGLIKKRGLNTKWSEENVKKIQEMVENGDSLAEIHEKFADCSINSIRGQTRKFKAPEKEKEKARNMDGFVEVLIGNRYVRLHRYIVTQLMM